MDYLGKEHSDLDAWRIMAYYRLYRGIVPPLLGVTPIFAVSFWVRTDLLGYVLFRHTLYRHTIPPSSLSTLRHPTGRAIPCPQAN